MGQTHLAPHLFPDTQPGWFRCSCFIPSSRSVGFTLLNPIGLYTFDALGFIAEEDPFMVSRHILQLGHGSSFLFSSRISTSTSAFTNTVATTLIGYKAW